MDRCWKNHAAVEIPEVPTYEARREAARVAAEEARSATVRCDAESEKAETEAQKAEAAAARCVKARDNAAAAMVARMAVAGRARRKTALSAELKADAVHEKERTATAAAALAAREASVGCAAACGDVAAAALADREAAELVRVLEDAATEEARAAAAAGVAVRHADAASRQAAADVAVKRADAAALAARKAAASCDEALAHSSAEDDKKFLDSMRGWLMTVAALLINMTFTAIIHPPSWVPTDFGVGFRKNAASAAPPSQASTPSPAADRDTIKPRVVNRMGSAYLGFNSATFGTAIILLVMLLLMEKGAPAKTLRSIRLLMTSLIVWVALSFASATSSDPRVGGRVLGTFGVYALAVVFSLWLTRYDKV